MNYKSIITAAILLVSLENSFAAESKTSNAQSTATRALQRLAVMSDHLDPQQCPHCRITQENANDVVDRLGNTRAHVAAIGGDAKIIMLLASMGADLNKPNLLGHTPVQTAAQSINGLPALEALIISKAELDTRTSDNNSALHFAAGASDDSAQDRAVALINAGAAADVANDAGQTPFLLAAEKGANKQQLLEKLFEQRVATNARNIFDGTTALHHAAFEGNEWLVAQLSDMSLNKNNAKPNMCPVDAAQVNGFTPLHYACRQGHEVVARLLVSRGADPARASASWQSLMCNPAMKLTPLHCAAMSGNLKLVKLIAALAPRTIHSKTSEGKTPASCASNEQVRTFLEALEQQIVPFMRQCDVDADGTPRARL